MRGEMQVPSNLMKSLLKFFATIKMRNLAGNTKIVKNIERMQRGTETLKKMIIAKN